jgi:hypothetical protein
LELGNDERGAQAVVADAFGHSAGLLLLKHTHRIKMFGCPARKLMTEYLDRLVAQPIAKHS